MKTIKWKEFFQIEQNKLIVYQIIPHANVTNNNKRLWKSIYKMYEMYERTLSRLERNGYKITYREKDYLWFDIVFKQIYGQKKIEFYVSTSEFQSVKLKRKIENKMQVTIKEMDRDVLKVPEENTLIQEIKYLKHDIFSASTSASDTQTPIASILNTVDELQFDGDFARLSICNEAENRQKWIKNAQWASEKMRKGNIPQRASLNGNRLKKVISTGLSGLINEVNDLLTETFQAFSNTFFKSEKKFEKKKVIVKSYSLEDEISAKSRNQSSLEKINLPVFKSRIRVVAHSEDRLTRETLSETLSLSFGELSDNNEFHGIKVRVNGNKHKTIIKELNTLQLSNRTKTDVDVNLISTDEMNKLALQMPFKELQRRYDEALNIKQKVETQIPEIFTRNKGVFLGESEVKDKNFTINIPVDNPDELFRTYVFQGSQGMGKDTAIKNFVVDACLNHGIGSIVPDAIMEDGARGLADGIRDALPPEKVIDLDLSDVDYPVPMDLTEIIQKLGRNGANRFAQELIDFFGDVESMGQSRSILREFAKASNGSILEIKLLIENENYRESRIKELRKEGDERLANSLANWSSVYEEQIKYDKDGNIKSREEKIVKDGQKSLDAKAAAVLYRLDELFGDDHLFNIFAQPPKEELNFEKWMNEGKVVILRIPNRKLGTLATKTLMHWIVLKTFMTRLLSKEGDGTFIVFNEPHQYMTPGLQKLLQRIVLEGRKWKIGSLFAFHHIGLLPRDFADDLQASGTNWFLFSNTHKGVYERLKEELEPTFDIEAAMSTEKFHAICLLQFGGKRQTPFLCRMSPPPKTTYDNSFLTKRHSRVYGRHIDEVEKIIMEKEKIS